MPCIMPEMPYCPACKYGYITKSEDAPDTDCEWVCLYKEKENETDALNYCENCGAKMKVIFEENN